jgi:hypothetical protein
MALFKRLPDQLFYPLAGPNSLVFEAVLTRLYTLFYSPATGSTLPTYLIVRGEIEEVLATLAINEWTPESEDEAPPELTGKADRLVWLVYHRLRKTGWIEDEIDGYNHRVTMPPDVGALLGKLIEIKSQRRFAYGGMVQAIHNNLKAVSQQPEEQAAVLETSARYANEFFQHLRSLAYGLRELGKTLKGIRDSRILLGSFFSDFVEEFLVADYKTLHTKENPFRFRTEILRLVRELKFDAPIKKILARKYQELGISRQGEESLLKVEGDIERIEAVFSEVDSHLSRIDAFRAQLERRVAESVRYLDKTQHGASARLARLITGIGRQSDQFILSLPPPHALARVLPLSVRSLRQPISSRKPPTPEVLRVRPVDPEKARQQEQVIDYLNRRTISPQLVASYLDRQLGGGLIANGSELRVASVEDFVAAAHARFILHMAKNEPHLRRRYAVEPVDGTVDNDWMETRDFQIKRNT